MFNECGVKWKGCVTRDGGGVSSVKEVYIVLERLLRLWGEMGSYIACFWNCVAVFAASISVVCVCVECGCVRHMESVVQCICITCVGW